MIDAVVAIKDAYPRLFVTISGFLLLAFISAATFWALPRESRREEMALSFLYIVLGAVAGALIGSLVSPGASSEKEVFKAVASLATAFVTGAVWGSFSDKIKKFAGETVWSKRVLHVRFLSTMISIFFSAFVLYAYRVYAEPLSQAEAREEIANMRESLESLEIQYGLAGRKMAIDEGDAIRKDAPLVCSAPEHRLFDFWLGAWRVEKPDGTLAGINRISPEYGGCVVHERYTTKKGYIGESLNSWDPARKVWRQTWVDSEGLLLTLEGGWNGNSMVLEGESPGTDGAMSKKRITWTPNADGSVRQLWETSDGKGGWTVAFDGRYTKQ